MNKIIILDENTSNQIAAGEVIERPASVVKELVENSIDAGADSISVEISRGGISLIRVADNGSGIPSDDVEMAFERHGTSKIKSAGDLSSIRTMGFRGEALPSIASVSRIEMDTAAESGNGIRITMTGGELDGKRKSSRDRGTMITVRDLFFNTPARYKFLKSDANETRACTDIISRLALAHPGISFRYIANREEILRTPGDGKLENVVFCVYGREISENLYPVDYGENGYRVQGYAGNSSAARGNRQNQTLFVNGRYVRSREVTAAVEKAYETGIMKGKFPFFIINIQMEPGVVDVNVHPAKSEVRFARGGDVFLAVYSAIKEALDSNRGIIANGIAKIRPKIKVIYDDGHIPGTAAPRVEDYFPPAAREPVIPGELHEAMKAAKETVYNIREGMDHSRVRTEIPPAQQGAAIPEKGIGLLKEAVFAGILFNTFILMELNGDEMLVIDQHAAHERINYENLLERHRNKEMNSQMLLSPQPVRLTAAEAADAEENRALLESLGFEFDFIGPYDAVIRSMPAELSESNSGEAFRGAIDSMGENKGRERTLVENEAIYSMACKNSVKANTVLTQKEVEALVDRLGKLDNPYTCPHGRPAVVKLARREFEKLFKRIV
ncbi:MAG: DNA mismatch repair endonuclease MutL [Clostridia bacterium]|nr:DNA mismatch repair endonuclease MutL [Clostridia bacterium]